MDHSHLRTEYHETEVFQSISKKRLMAFMVNHTKIHSELGDKQNLHVHHFCVLWIVLSP